MNKTVNIEGMMCKNCVRHVKEAFEAKGINANVSLEDKCAILENTNISDDEIKDIIEELGFEITGIK